MPTLITTITKLTWRRDLDPEDDDTGQDQYDAPGQEVVPRRTPKPGIVMPASFRTSAKYVDQPTAVLAPRASSKIRSQPMIQAMNSPRLARRRCSRTGDRHGAGELGAQHSQRWAIPANTNERATAGPARTPAAAPKSTKDAGADDDPDAEDGQLDGPKLAQLVLRFLRVTDRLLDRLGPSSSAQRLLRHRPEPHSAIPAGLSAS